MWLCTSELILLTLSKFFVQKQNLHITMSTYDIFAMQFIRGRYDLHGSVHQIKIAVTSVHEICIFAVCASSDLKLCEGFLKSNDPLIVSHRNIETKHG